MRRFIGLIACLTSVLVCTSSALASIDFQDGNFLKLSRKTVSNETVAYGSNGGLFLGTWDTDGDHTAVNGYWETFCVEIDEGIVLNSWYEGTLAGSTSSTPPRQLTSFAAWMYDRFTIRSASLGFTSDDPEAMENEEGGPTLLQDGEYNRLVTSLQVGFWREFGFASDLIQEAGVSDEEMADAELDLGIDLDGGTSDIGTYGGETSESAWRPEGGDWAAKFTQDKSWSFPDSTVKVIQVRTGKLDRQDQLVLLPGTTNVTTPEPISLAVWSALSLGGLALARLRAR
jgi:hypothetical protein